MNRLWWADDDDDDSVISAEPDAVEEHGPGTGYRYSMPVQVGPINIETQGDFIYHSDELRTILKDEYGDEMGESIFSDLSRGMTNVNDPDAMDGAAFELLMLTASVDVGKVEAVLQQMVTEEVVELSTVEKAGTEETQEALDSAVKELTLDMFNTTPPDTGFDVINPVAPQTSIDLSRSSRTGPPLCPIIPESKAKYLVLSSQPPEEFSLVEARVEWLDMLRQYDKDFPHEGIETYEDSSKAATSRSNVRPREYAAVYVEYENGDKINVGSHGYVLFEDSKMELDFRSVDLALCELFAAPGGESLTCPTPSHLLHQIVSAVISNALMDYDPVVEKENIDMAIRSPPTKFIKSFNFDFTTSAGIWNKKLVPDGTNPKFVYQAAVSKYDMAMVILHEVTGDAHTLVYQSVANCLGCEFPSHFRKKEGEISRDLAIQDAIYSKIASFSQNKLKELGSLCYDAAILESQATLDGLDIHEQGMPWKDKKAIMVETLNGLRPRKDIAIPPLPLSEVKGFANDNFSLKILGHDFVAGPYSMQGRTLGHSYVMESSKVFLRDYPAVGIVSYEDAQEIAKIIDQSPLKISGSTHKGPLREYQSNDSPIADICDILYSHSSNAQYAEIRADLVRSIYKNPMPKRDVWVQVYLYKGKVSAWYRSRDAPNSPDGYRIDWFAVSTFEVLGSIKMETNQGEQIYLWPRQKLRSQDMGLVHSGPRRLKATLFSMLEKMSASRTNMKSVVLAWERLATTLNSSTYGSGKMFITCRYLSSTISSPSSPFHKMAKKLENPVTFADVCYIERLKLIMGAWVNRDQYTDRSAILGLPRSYGQLESYWMMWVPSNFADSKKNMTDCVTALYDEAAFLEETMATRVADLERQYNLVVQDNISLSMLRRSLKQSTELDTDGKMGWTWIGSLASAHALNQRGSAASFDRKYGRGTKARNITNHLTVRHSARLDVFGRLEKGTVAEMMLRQGIDNYLSTVPQTYRFLFKNRPFFFNHPKGGEHKPREISITDPDSRVCLSDAELICGLYGKTTGVDFLKDPTKNLKFFRNASRTLTRGGGIQSSDATRYGPCMSNFAIAIMLLLLGAYSTHLKWASVVYARLAFRQMLIPKSITPYLHKLSAHADTKQKSMEVLKWMSTMPTAGFEDGSPLLWYCTAHHMGQGMSHHSSSLLHAGGLIVAIEAVLLCRIVVSGKKVCFDAHIMVTSDDSTIIVEPFVEDDGAVLSRPDRQVSARIFLQMVRECRRVALRMVSVLPNLIKEVISAVKGEFNSQDTGIGATCPILGFRELVSLIVTPSAPSLVGDYLNAFACSRDIAFAGQGLGTAAYVHRLMLDAIEERWGITEQEKKLLTSLSVLPTSLVTGCDATQLVGSPAALLSPNIRGLLLKESIEVNSENPDLDPNTRDSVFAPLMHVKVAMSRQHRRALTELKKKIAIIRSEGRIHQCQLLEQSLQSTLSSARSRNLGRIAFRIRLRKVSPRKYRDIDFEENTMIESTLNWLSHVNNQMLAQAATPEDIRLGNTVAGFVEIYSRQRATFPRPPKLRRHYPAAAKKPVFMLDTYGVTPFGEHAIERSGVSVVHEIGASERSAVQVYLALSRHRSFSEHVEYGGGFIVSWSNMLAGVIVALDISNDIRMQMEEHIKVGDFSQLGISKLQQICEEYPSLPVLALHTHDGIRGLWHAIHNGRAYTVMANYDLEVHTSDAIYHQIESGEYVILALQGFASDVKWQDTVPTAQEVRDYQMDDYNKPSPSIVRNLEHENMVSGPATGATYATEVMNGDSLTLLYIAPNITSTPERNRSLRGRIPYLRAKVVAALSSAGYWHSSLRGVAFRAYLRGCYWGETIWTGGVIGWRLSSSSIPVYYSSTGQSEGVRALVILGGFDDVDQISRYNPDVYSPGFKIVYQSNTVTYDNVIQVSDQYRDLIINANYGKRFHLGTGHGGFVDFALGPPPQPSEVMTPEIARDQILDMLNGNVDDMGW